MFFLLFRQQEISPQNQFWIKKLLRLSLPGCCLCRVCLSLWFPVLSAALRVDVCVFKYRSVCVCVTGHLKVLI